MMNREQQRRGQDLLDRIEQHLTIVVHHYTRYQTRPDTELGRQDYSDFAKQELKFDKAIKDLRSLLYELPPARGPHGQ